MPIPSVYINLEDDVSRITTRLKKEKSPEAVLVCPKRCFLFSDPINLKLLKKQADLLGKRLYILTMDEKGQSYAQDAGFELKFLPKSRPAGGGFDIKTSRPKNTLKATLPAPEPNAAGRSSTIQNLKRAASALVGSSVIKDSRQVPAVNSTVPRMEVDSKLPVVKKTENYYPKELEIQHEHKGRRGYFQKIIVSVFIISLLAVTGAVFLILPHATVVIYPKTEPVTRDMDIGAAVAVAQPDVENLLLPAQKISEQLEVSSKFQTQGKKEVGNKAAGTVRLYNFSPQPLNLKANTTILTVGNKVYHLTEDQLGVRVTKYKDERTKEVDLSTLSNPVGVIADQGGEGYNLPAGLRMEVTNQVFGSRPQFLFAKTESAIIGGTSRFLSVVSQQDLESSRNTLGDQLIKKLQDQLKGQSLQLIEKAYMIEVLEFAADKQVGSESPSFNAVLKAKITGLAINPDNLNKLVSDRIIQTLPSNKTLKQNGEGPQIKLKSADLNADKAVISIHYEGRAVLSFDWENLAGSLVGKTRDQAAEILRSKAEVDRIDITLVPSWQKSFPWLKNKILLKTAEVQ